MELFSGRKNKAATPNKQEMFSNCFYSPKGVFLIDKGERQCGKHGDFRHFNQQGVPVQMNQFSGRDEMVCMYAIQEDLLIQANDSALLF